MTYGDFLGDSHFVGFVLLNDVSKMMVTGVDMNDMAYLLLDLPSLKQGSSVD